MLEKSALLGLPYIQASQSQKHVTHNEAVRALDVLVQAAVADRDRTAAPAEPDEGDRHLVASPATGAWAGQDHALAVFENGAWRFHPPRPGWRVEVLADQSSVIWDGTQWRSGESVGKLGVNAKADSVNRLSVSASATLLSHEGTDHRLKINKAGVADSGSLLFQTGWSGRAEMGCVGEDGFSIKVSADGETWTDALHIDAATGRADGAAVQQTATDTTPGRLARADHAFGPGNLLGPVAQDAGVPTGGVIERGSNAAGEFVKFADGTLICTALVAVDVTQVGYQAFPFPAPFAAPPTGSLAHGSHQPNAALEYGNIRSLSLWDAPFQEWGLVLKSPGSTLGGVADQLRVQAIGRWF